MLKVAKNSITSSVILSGFQFECQERFTVKSISRNISPKVCIGGLKRLLRRFEIYLWCSGVHPLDVTRHIRLSGGKKPSCGPQQFQGLVIRGLWWLTVLCQVLTEENNSAKKIAVAKIWVINILEIRLKGMADWAYQTNSLNVKLNCSISRKCYFLDTQLQDMSILAISTRSVSNSLSVCMWEILKPRCIYSLLTCLIPS